MNPILAAVPMDSAVKPGIDAEIVTWQPAALNAWIWGVMLVLLVTYFCFD